MPAPSYVLSESFSLRDVHSRIELLCGQVSKNTITRYSIVVQMKVSALKVTSLGKGGFRKFFVAQDPFTIASSVIDLKNKGLVGVLSVVCADVTNLNSGETGIFHPIYDYDEFIRLQFNKESNKYDRYYYPELGKKQIRVWSGSGCKTITDVVIEYERTPYLGFTLADVDGDTEKIDLYDFMVPFVMYDAAISLTKESVAKDAQSPLQADIDQTVMNMNQMIQASDDRLKATNKDQ